MRTPALCGPTRGFRTGKGWAICRREVDQRSRVSTPRRRTTGGGSPVPIRTSRPNTRNGRWESSEQAGGQPGRLDRTCAHMMLSDQKNNYYLLLVHHIGSNKRNDC